MATESASSNKTDRKFKVVVLGDGGTGKTTFLRRFVTGSFEPTYEPTMGVHVYSMTYATSVGERLCFECWDTSGQERLGSLRDAYYRGADCAILFFDVLARTTYKNSPLWYKDLKRVEADAKVVLVGNKVDVERRQVKPKQVALHRKWEVPYIELSAKANYNLEKPFLYLARELLEDTTLEFLEGLPVVEPDIEIDLSRLVGAEQEPLLDDALEDST